MTRSRNRRFFVSFLPAISNASAQHIRDAIRDLEIPAKRLRYSLDELAKLINPCVQGWINYLFTAAITTIVLVAMMPELRTIAGKAIKMDAIIEMMMLAFGGLMLLLTNTPVKKVPEGVVFKSGLVAAIAIFGIAWMSDTYFQQAMPVFQSSIKDMVNQHPWSIAFAMFTVSVVINSQAATARMMLPLALGLGLSPQLAIMPSVYGYFFIPNYPSDIATGNFDSTGTTKIGKYYFNHSFMMPGLIGVISACCIGYLLASIIIQ